MRGMWPFNMKYLEHLNILNISIIMIILLMAGYEYYDAKKKEPIKVSPSKNMRLDTAEVKLDDMKKLLARGDYMVVAEKNVFHPERKPTKSQPDAPPPEFTVYGTIVGATKAAFIEDKKNPYSTQGRGQRQRLVHEGDTISGYKVSKITAEDVEFTQNDNKLTVRVIDSAKKKTRQSVESTRTATATPAPAQTPSPMPPMPSQVTPPPMPSMPMPALPMPMPPQAPASKSPPHSMAPAPAR